MPIIDDDDELEAQRRRAASAPEFSYESIAADPWSAVYGMIPQGADAGLLKHAYDRVMECCNAATGLPATALHAVAPLQGGYGWDITREENFEHAVRRLDELDSRLRPTMRDDEAERQAAPEKEQAAEKEAMTVEAIERDPWAAVDRDIPPDADRAFLATAAVAAEQCEKFAFAAARVGEMMEPELVEFYQERRADAAERRDEAWRQFTVRAPEQGSQTRLLNPEQLQDRAMSSLHAQAHEHREAAGQGAEITHEALDKNPWVVLTGTLSEFDDRELLDRIGETASDLKAEATQRSAGADSREEAELWKVIAGDAENRRREARETPGAATRDLPPDPEGMNDDRAEWAHSAVREFQSATGSNSQDALSDLLGDLMHFADRQGFDFDAELDRARMHYEAETMGEEEEVELTRPEPLTLEAIQRDPWNAIKLDLPDDANPELRGEVYWTAHWAEREAMERHEFAETRADAEHWLELSIQAQRRMDQTNFLTGADKSEIAAAPEPAAEKEPMTVEAIGRDPRNAIDLDIPQDASRELLTLVATTADRFRETLLANGHEAATQESPGDWSDYEAADARYDEAWLELQTRDMREAAAAPQFSRETIAADWWTTVYLPIPQEAEPFAIGSEFSRAENIEHATARIAELDERLELARAQELAAEKEPLTIDVARLRELENERDSFVIGAPDGTETHDPEEWRLQNPKDAEELAELARAQEFAAEKDHIKEQLLEREPVESAQARMYDFAFGAIFDALDAAQPAAAEQRDKAQLAEEILFKQGDPLPELHQAIIDGSALAVVPLWITDAERERQTDTAERSPLADDRAGDEISRPLSAAERNERVRRIIENPHLEGAERDDGVLQALAEQREELGLAEPARQDDAPQVEYSQEPEVQSSADRDAAEIDYLFGREEMTEARAAAYDRYTGQELSPRTGQTAGQVQEAGQSQSHTRGRSR